MEGCDLFAVDVDRRGRFAVVRGLQIDGTLVWLGTVPGTPLAGDVFGGLLALVGPFGKPSKVLGRFDRADAKATPWRYYAKGVIEDTTQTGDGTIYLVEDTKPARQIVVIDGRSGAVKERIQAETGAVLGPLSAAESNTALVEVKTKGGLSLARVTPAGLQTVTQLPAAADTRPEPGLAIETPNGTVAFWTDGPTLRFAIVSGPSVVTEFTTRSQQQRRRHAWDVLVDAFESPWVYVSDGTKIEAVDLLHRERRWQLPFGAVPFEAVDGRHVVVSDAANHRVMELDDRGAVVVTLPVKVSYPRLITQGNGIFHGFDPITRSVVEISERVYVESGWFSLFSITTP
jgi:hypothetical protein